MKGIWYSEDYDEQYGSIKMVCMFDGENVVNAISIPSIMLFEASCIKEIEELSQYEDISLPSVEVRNKIIRMAMDICKQISAQSNLTKSTLKMTSGSIQ
jgi:hypothetical protein